MGRVYLGIVMDFPFKGGESAGDLIEEVPNLEADTGVNRINFVLQDLGG